MAFLQKTCWLSDSGNLRRREDIRRYWFFDCRCRRCCDVTELGTNMSGILCFSCNRGFLLPNDTLDYKSDWSCVSCKTSLNYETVDEVLTAIEYQVRTCGSKRVRISVLRVPSSPKVPSPWSETLKEIFNSLTKRSSCKVSPKKWPVKTLHTQYPLLFLLLKKS
jgi:hypothetical protein